MAKKKEDTVVETQDDFNERIYRSVEKDFGEGVLISGDEASAAKPTIVSISPVLDIMTGGILEGSWVGITGPEKSGKTTLALQIAANAQKPENGSRPVYYDKVEGRLSIHHLKGIKGLDLSKGKFNIIQSREGRILSQEERLGIVQNILETVPGAVVIIDSISAYLSAKEQTGGIGTETRGGGAKTFSQFIRLTNQIVPVNRSIVIGITHLICDTGNPMAGKIERAARAWKYQYDYSLRTIYAKNWMAGERVIGLKTQWLCKTSPLVPPGMKAESHIRFGVGIDRLYELILLGTSIGLIKQAGAWYSLELLRKPDYRTLYEGKDPPKAQGAEKLYQLLEEHPEWAKAVEKEVMQMAGGLSLWGAEE